eukprot:NODE_639_length_5118_cov_0.568440.p2 type:complete len:324 gc:universal NODE_639_length_5118_cov_0.568440:991-20(-)
MSLDCSNAFNLLQSAGISVNNTVDCCRVPFITCDSGKILRISTESLLSTKLGFFDQNAFNELKNLTFIDMSGLNMTSKDVFIPYYIQEAYFEDNLLSGDLTIEKKTIGNETFDRSFVFRSNLFTSVSIEASQVKVDLSHNLISKLKIDNPEYLDASNNKLEGSLSIGGAPSYLDVSNNHLTFVDTNFHKLSHSPIFNLKWCTSPSKHLSYKCQGTCYLDNLDLDCSMSKNAVDFCHYSKPCLNALIYVNTILPFIIVISILAAALYFFELYSVSAVVLALMLVLGETGSVLLIFKVYSYIPYPLYIVEGIFYIISVFILTSTL